MARAGHGAAGEGQGTGVPSFGDVHPGEVEDVFKLLPVKVVGVCEACATDSAVGEAVLRVDEKMPSERARRTQGSPTHRAHIALAVAHHTGVLVDMGDELLGAAEIQRAERTNKVVAVVCFFLALLFDSRCLKAALRSLGGHVVVGRGVGGRVFTVVVEVTIAVF